MRERRATVTIFFAIWSLIVFGLAAVGVDGGYWYVMRRQVQNAADAAAIAGVAALAWNEANGPGNTATAAQQVQQIVNAGLTAAANNGIGSNATVAINNFTSAAGITTAANPGPTTGPYAAGSGIAKAAQYAPYAVEAIIHQPASGLLSTLIENLAGINPPTIAARAVALYATGQGSVCALALSGSVSFSGNTTVNAPNCVIASDYAGSGAIQGGGSSALTAYSLTAVGSISVGSGATLTEPPTAYQPATADPFAAANYYQFPTNQMTAQTLPSNGSKSGVIEVTPGYYNSSISMKGTYQFDPGLYLINGDFDANAQATATCTGCTIVLLNGGTFKFNGGATITFSADANVQDGLGNSYPALNGVVFYQQPPQPFTPPPTSTSSMKFNGNSTLNLQGAMYFPTADINIQGNDFSNIASINSCFVFVAASITFTGNNTTNFNTSACKQYGLSLNTHYIQLVE